MKSRTLFRRVLPASILQVTFLVLVNVLIGSAYFARAGGNPFGASGSLLSEASSQMKSVRITFEGSVELPNGAPAKGAVVVSSAGGQAVTDASGVYALDVDLFHGVDEVQITAVGGVGEKLIASRSISVPAKSPRVSLSPMELVQGSVSSPSWLPSLGGQPGTNGTVNSFVVFDDGSGAALYVGGSFSTVGGVQAESIARWDGVQWTALGTGLSGIVKALAVFDDGSGAAIYAGGFIPSAGGMPVNDIAKWDGGNWSALGAGMNDTVEALTVFDDGSGAALFIGGRFTTANGVGAERIAKWDGSSFSPLGSGVSLGVPGGPSVDALATFDDGSGDALYAAGFFFVAGGAPAEGVAKWDGASWAPLGAGLVGGSTQALSVFDDGSGAALFAAGDFFSAGGSSAGRIAKWDGTSWSTLSGGVSNFSIVDALSVFDDGSGTALYAGGDFFSAGGSPVERIAKWDGANWSALGAGVNSLGVEALAVFDDGGGEVLFVGGGFSTAGGVASKGVATWDGSDWSPLGSGLNNSVISLTVFDDGSGAALYAGGNFIFANGEALNGIGKWDGSNWSPLGVGVSSGIGFSAPVNALAVFNDGGGDALYAGGGFILAGGASANRIAKWDGATWTPLGSGMDGTVFDLAVFDDGAGSGLYAGGIFSVAGGIGANRIAKWNGSNWMALGNGTNNSINALTVFNDGTGAALYAGGTFTAAGTLGEGAARRIAKWNGSSWSALGSGMNANVNSLASFDDGGGLALYAGGGFTNAGGGAANRVARWDGASWSALSTGMNSGSVLSLIEFDDGAGACLYAGGGFTTAGGVAALRIAKWDGANWSALGSGLNGFANTLEVFDDGKGAALFVGGNYSTAPDSGDSYLAKWGSENALTSDAASISLTTGGQQPLALDSGAAQAGWFYFVFGSVTGTTPGIDFGGGVLLPLNFDIFFNLTLTKPNLAAFGNYRGMLDAAGQAQATFTLPALMDPSLVGVTINHAYLAGSTFGVPEFASNAVPLTLVL